MKLLAILLVFILVLAPFLVTWGKQDEPPFKIEIHDWLWIVPMLLGYVYTLVYLIRFIVTP